MNLRWACHYASRIKVTEYINFSFSKYTNIKTHSIQDPLLQLLHNALPYNNILRHILLYALLKWFVIVVCRYLCKSQ